MSTEKQGAYLLIVHGTKDKESNQAFLSLVEQFQDLCPDRFVAGAFMEFVEPSIGQAIDECAQKGVGQIFVLPMMFFGGKHVKEDIPLMIQEAKAKHPELDFHYGTPIADQPLLLKVLETKMRQMEKSCAGK
ncbi:MAG: CbiX/SirB N-terminal domain-containing protein [Candidatus Omnitrophica bacterium]|nr:CbiX/SirB N-terminal domain-containing protein [Candidatus Omnitrophota bacterium]